MKIIIDAYRGGNDIGRTINGQYEKNILLNISKKLSDKLNELGIKTELVRTSDISLTDDERNSIINEIKSKNDIIIQNRLSDDKEFDIIYPLRTPDNLSSSIAKNLESQDIIFDKYYQRRLPTNTVLDYYSVIRNTLPNETIIIEYLDEENYDEIINIIAKSLYNYISRKNKYIVQKGDSLYQIAKKYNTTVDELKQTNNLTGNTLSIGQELTIPESQVSPPPPNNTYIVQKGDSLYQIAKKYNTTVNELKQTNNLTSNTLSIGQKLTIPESQVSPSPQNNTYIVQKGDSLYQIAKKYNTTVNEIKKLNNLENNLLNIGQKLEIPVNNENQATNYITYTIIKGDSLYQIAKKYNTTVDEIKNINNLTSNNLSIGQKLKIPR